MLMLTTIGKQMLLIILCHATVRFDEIEPVVIFPVLTYGDAAGKGSPCGSRFALGPIQHTQEGEILCLTALGQIVVLYLDEERQLQRIEKNVEFTTQVGAPQGSDISCRCIWPGDLFAAPCAGGIEVRLNLEFHVLTARPVHVNAVRQARLGEPRCGEGKRPSVILRLPEPGEELWDIAKTCGTTKSRIMQANELVGEDIPQQKMLLIPSVR